MLLSPEGQTVQAWEIYKRINAVAEVGKHLMEKVLYKIQDINSNRLFM
jgi:hypothetical protein